MDPRALLLELAPLPEDARAAYVAAHLPGAWRDGLGNVFAGEGKLLLLAHLDTVLPPGPVRLQGGRLYGAGVGDNSAGVAVLLSLPPLPGVVRGFTVGEEGLGNLKGARALVAALSPETVVAVDGYLPVVVDRALGAVRFRVRLSGPGGHAWGDRGAPHPVFALAEGLGAARALLEGKEASLNATGLKAEAPVNAIPKEAEALLELRALEEEVLEGLLEAVEALFRNVARAWGLGLSLEVLGTRPVGTTATPRLKEAARRALMEIGERPLFLPGSTDASAAIERGIPALALGAYRGGGAHTPGEWVLPESLLEGRKVLLAFLRALGVG